MVSEFVGWGERMKREGRLVSHVRLKDVFSDPGRVCSASAEGIVVTDGPLADAQEVVGGFAVVEAASYDEAVALCRDHPATRAGKIVIRRVR